MQVKKFFDKDTGTMSYVVFSKQNNECAIIDPVLDFDITTGKVSTHSADALIDFISNNNLTTKWILETHIHADHLSGAGYLKKKLGGKSAISDSIKDVLQMWVKVFDTHSDTDILASHFDHLLKDGEEIFIDDIKITAIKTTGHTPACMSYIINEALFVGDTIFAPHLGTARTDFPGGSAKELYNSIQKILSYPDHYTIYHCHDYPSASQEPVFTSTVLEQKEKNSMINKSVLLNDFIDKRTARDKTLKAPKLLLPSLQVNLRNGEFGKPNHVGQYFIKIPVKW